MKLLDVLLVLGVVWPCVNGATWSTLLQNPFTVNASSTFVSAYAKTAMSSYVVGSWPARYQHTGFSVYYDRPPVSGGGPGYELMELVCYQNGGQPSDSETCYAYGDDYGLGLPNGPFLQHHITRLCNSNVCSKYFFYTPVSAPNTVKMIIPINTCQNPPPTDCDSCVGYDGYWIRINGIQQPLPSVLVYTAPAGYDIATVSTTVFNDNKYIAISLVSHGEPGPVVLLKSYDMVTFQAMGMNITQEDGSSIVSWESFAIFSAASPVNSGEEALYIYHIESSESKAFLRYASPTDLSIGRFQNILNIVSSFNLNDRFLVEQMGTAAAVSPNGQTIFLIRHGQDYCDNTGNKQVVQKTFNPITQAIVQEDEVLVKDQLGQIRHVNSPVMPALSADRCGSQGTAFTSRQVSIVWPDSSNGRKLNQGFYNPW